MSQTGIPEVTKEAENVKRLRQTRIEAIKDAAGWGWIAATLAALAAMNLSEDPTIKDVGAVMFLGSLLGPGVLMAKDAVEGVADKWQSKEKSSSE